MRVRKSEMARRIRICLSSLKCGSMDRGEQVDRIIHYFARLHGVGVASEETEKDIRYVFVRYQHSQFHETDGDDYATFDVYTDLWLTHTWFMEYATRQNVEDMLYHIEESLKITTHWEEYLKEDASSRGFRSNAWIVDDLVPEKPKKHDDSLDAMTNMLQKHVIELMEKNGYFLHDWKSSVDVASMYPCSLAEMEYIKNDVKSTQEYYRQRLLARNSVYGKFGLPSSSALDISEVIFNDPATIVLWRDGSKTVVKAQDGETYDPEKGLAMAICKKAMGNTRNYYITFKKHLKKWKKENPDEFDTLRQYGVVK